MYVLKSATITIFVSNVYSILYLVLVVTTIHWCSGSPVLHDHHLCAPCWEGGEGRVDERDGAEAVC